MLTIIFSWLVLFVAISLIGKLLIRKSEWFEYFWVGLVAVIGILQIWSLFLPVNVFSLAFIFGISGISLLITLKGGLKLPKINIRFIVISAVLLFSISYFASLSVGWPDTYGYHLIAVKWAGLYKIVPGLANLYSRLGFNSSFFLFASMIDNFFLKDRSSHVALSLLASVLSIEFLWILVKTKSSHLKVFVLLVLPVLVEGIVHSAQVSSLSYDFAVLLLVLAICVELITNNKKSIFIAAILSFLLVTIKLSGAVFSSVVIIFALYGSVFRKSKAFGSLWLFISTGLILVVPYLIRNVILSGWPLYPLPSLGLNISWAMPRDRVVDLLNVIKGWAIFEGQWGKAIGMPFKEWFPIWFLARLGTTELRIFFLAILSLLASMVLGFLNKKVIKKNTGLVICVLAAGASIFYLIYNAPDLRFGGIFFWILFASVGSFFFAGLIKKNLNFAKLLVLFSIFLVAYVSWPPRMDSVLMLKSVRWDQPGDRNWVIITPKDGSPPFGVYVAKDTSSCGNSELPCTSEPAYDFKEIVPGDISKGFEPVK